MPFNARWQRASPPGRMVVVSLVLLVAVPVAAQPAYAPEAVGAAPPGVERERSPAVARVGAELGMGVVTSLGLGLGAGLVGGAVGLAACSKSSGGIMSGFCPWEAALLSGMVGVGVGLPLGVWWGGKMTGGNGKFMGALAGFGTSLALGGAAFALEQQELGAGLMLATPILTVVGYELTDSAPRDAAPATVVAPAVGLRTGGASFGLQGSF